MYFLKYRNSEEIYYRCDITDYIRKIIGMKTNLFKKRKDQFHLKGFYSKSKVFLVWHINLHGGFQRNRIFLVNKLEFGTCFCECVSECVSVNVFPRMYC